MRHSTLRPAAVPLRALIVALLLTGLGLWQAWTCTDGTMTSPIAATTMTAAMGHANPTGHGTEPAHAAADEHSPGMPAGMTGLCITVLAGMAAALMLMSSPMRLLGLLRRLSALLIAPVDGPVRAPALARLCVSRT
jgi:hypothetical protein